MAGKKTIPVGQIRTWANTRMQTPDSTQLLDGLSAHQAFRLGIASLLEQILQATGNYEGFAYADPKTERYVKGVTDESRRNYR